MFVFHFVFREKNLLKEKRKKRQQLFQEQKVQGGEYCPQDVYYIIIAKKSSYTLNVVYWVININKKSVVFQKRKLLPQELLEELDKEPIK